jgi:LuxR family maltose regulon positive regulatory protein
MPRNPDIPRVQQQYLNCPEAEVDQPIRLDSERWFEWLEDESTRSFAFEGRTGHFTARKENKKRGNAYWYAYRWLNGKTTKAYLGTSRNLTRAKLDTVATKLAPQPATAKSSTNGRQNGAH